MNRTIGVGLVVFGLMSCSDGGMKKDAAIYPDWSVSDSQTDTLTPDGQQDDSQPPVDGQVDMPKTDAMSQDSGLTPDSMQLDAMVWPDTMPPPDTNPWTDASLADAVLPPDGLVYPDGPSTSCASVVGKPCTSAGGECGTQTCLMTNGTKGVCTCPCIPDNSSTPLVNEDSCPGQPQNACGTVALSTGTSNFCMKKCAPKIGSSDCAGGLSCDPRSGSAVGLYGSAVCLYYGCTANSDCPVFTNTVCSPTSPCGAGEACIPLVSGGTTGYCAKDGKCDLLSGLCSTHTLGKATAKVGDPCKDDTECGNNMACLMERNEATYKKKWLASCTSDSECCSGTCQYNLCTQGLCTVNNRNGYCSISGCTFAASLTIRACPAGSTCSSLYSGGLCFKTCSMSTATDCRGHSGDLIGDYECRGWDNLTIGGKQISASPVCEPGTSMPCTMLAGTTLNCSAVGNMSNTTNMACRNLANTVLSNAYDPNGYCLDTTSSGSLARSPMPTP